MKKLSYVLVLVLALSALLISACGASAPVSSTGGGGKPQASPVEFTGVIESINGNEWSINGQTITVDPAVVRDGPFAVGDTVKVEVKVQTDGSMVVSSVEAPGADDNSNDANSNDDNVNDDNVNDDNANEDNSNDANSNDTNSNDDNVNDANSNDDNVNDANSNDDDSNVNSNSNDDGSNDSNSNDDSSDDSSDDNKDDNKSDSNSNDD